MSGTPRRISSDNPHSELLAEQFDILGAAPLPKTCQGFRFVGLLLCVGTTLQWDYYCHLLHRVDQKLSIFGLVYPNRANMA